MILLYSSKILSLLAGSIATVWNGKNESYNVRRDNTAGYGIECNQCSTEQARLETSKIQADNRQTGRIFIVLIVAFKLSGYCKREAYGLSVFLNTEFPTRLQPRPLEWKPRDGILEYSGGYLMPKFTHAGKAFIQRITALTASTGLFIPLIYSIVTEAKGEVHGAVIVIPQTLKPTTEHLYNPAPAGLNCAHSVSRTDGSLRNFLLLADNRHGYSQSGFLFVLNKSRLFNGVTCSSAFMHAVTSRTDFSDYKHPARLRNELGASQSTLLEANHA